MCKCKALKKPKTHEEKKLEFNRVWEHFKYHAKQRLKTFHFYIIIAGAILTGFIALFAKNAFNLPCLDATSLKTLLFIKLILGLLLIIFSTVFWILDNRNDSMIHATRDYLIKMEKNKWFEIKFFSEIEKNTINTKAIRYSDCFNFIFVTFIIIGFVIFLYSAFQLYCT